MQEKKKKVVLKILKQSTVIKIKKIPYERRKTIREKNSIEKEIVDLKLNLYGQFCLKKKKKKKKKKRKRNQIQFNKSEEKKIT